MKTRIFAVVGVLALVVAALPASNAGAAPGGPPLPIPVNIDSRLKNTPAPKQHFLGSDVLPLGVETTAPQCGDPNPPAPASLTITISSFDPANPGDQDVVFWKESIGTSATLWVAWDFLATQYGRQDVITCDQLAYLQLAMDSIVNTDTYYFGAYDQRPAGNPNIDVMIYNIVDEGFFDPNYPFYIAGFFWSNINQLFNRNMIFIDSYDWANRLGPDVARPYLYEGTVAHELEHLIHNDHDPDEDSWVDEGMADLAEFLNGFGQPDGHVVYFLAYHRTPLTVWGGGLESYGASYLFQLYLLENFGEKDGTSFTGYNNSWTMKEIDEQANGIAGVQNATGANFNDLFDSWIVANYLDKPDETGAGGFPIGYNEVDLAPYMSPTYGAWSIEYAVDAIYGADAHGNLPVSRYYGGYISGSVEYPVGEAPPYAGFYQTYKGMEPGISINVRGAAASGVAPKTGNWEMASGGSNMLTDRTLALLTPLDTTSTDFTLTFNTWYDIETEWDFGFVEVSTDGGTTWAPIPGSITKTSTNPNHSTAWANSLVSGQASTDAAITGNSGGWVSASFPLPKDDNLMLRFNYYTDEATLGQGWFIDDVAVNGFSDGFEVPNADWNYGGWQRTTGLFDNDWIAFYVNPSYEGSQVFSLDWNYLDGVVSGKYETITGLLSTLALNRNVATVAFANRPGDSPFSAAYRILVKKMR